MTFSHLVDEGKLATVTHNHNDANGPGTEEATVAEDSTPTSTSDRARIWSSNEFWEFVDTLLGQTWAAVVAQESTIQGQQRILETCIVVWCIGILLTIQCQVQNVHKMPSGQHEDISPKSLSIVYPPFRECYPFMAVWYQQQPHLDQSLVPFLLIIIDCCCGYLHSYLYFHHIDCRCGYPCSHPSFRHDPS